MIMRMINIIINMIIIMVMPLIYMLYYQYTISFDYYLKVHLQNGRMLILKMHFHFLYFDHGLHTVSTQNVNFTGSTDALTAPWTNQLAGAAGPLPSRCGVGTCLGRSSGPCMDEGRETGPPDLNFVPPLFQRIFH